MKNPGLERLLSVACLMWVLAYRLCVAQLHYEDMPLTWNIMNITICSSSLHKRKVFSPAEFLERVLKTTLSDSMLRLLHYILLVKKIRKENSLSENRWCPWLKQSLHLLDIRDQSIYILAHRTLGKHKYFFPLLLSYCAEHGRNSFANTDMMTKVSHQET